MLFVGIGAVPHLSASQSRFGSSDYSKPKTLYLLTISEQRVHPAGSLFLQNLSIIQAVGYGGTHDVYLSCWLFDDYRFLHLRLSALVSGGC